MACTGAVLCDIVWSLGGIFVLFFWGLSYKIMVRLGGPCVSVSCNRRIDILHTELTNSITVADNKAQYDIQVKRLLANKCILAHILLKTVGAFSGMKPEEVAECIEGEPRIGIVPVEPGATNAKGADISGQRIKGLNTENAEINEGMVRFDIIFYVRLPADYSKLAGDTGILKNIRSSEKDRKRGLTQIIVNVEAQKDEPAAYSILNRSIFYASRLVSSQKERDFINSNYDDIKQVYSIWICMNMKCNSMSHIHLAKVEMLEPYDWKGNIDLLNIILIGITEKLPEHDEEYELHRLIGALLSSNIQVNEKLAIMEREYNLPINNDLRRDVNVMCNLSEGIEERATEKTTKEVNKKVILNMHKKGYTAAQIAEIVEVSAQEVEAVIKENNEI